MVLPQFVSGQSLTPDVSQGTKALGQGIASLIQRGRDDDLRAEEKVQFDRANDIYSQTSSFLQIDPIGRSAALIESAQQDRVNGNEEDYQEKIRISQMSDDLIEQELIQDFSNASNVLGRDPMGGLKQMGIGAGAQAKELQGWQSFAPKVTVDPETNEQYFNIPQSNRQTGESRVQRVKVEDYLASSMGETPEQQSQRKAAEAALKLKSEADAAAEASETTAATAAATAKATALAKDAAAGAKAAQGTFKTLKGANRIYDRAIAAIDKGAESGAFAKLLPSIRAETIELQNSIREAGLNTISGVTLGAISKPELELALAVDIPEGMDESDLKPYLQRKKKANIKLMKELNKMSSFLSKSGNTVAMWNEKWGGETDFSGIGSEAIEASDAPQVYKFDAQGNLIE